MSKHIESSILDNCALLGTVSVEDAMAVVRAYLDSEGNKIAKWNSVVVANTPHARRMEYVVGYAELVLRDKTFNPFVVRDALATAQAKAANAGLDFKPTIVCGHLVDDLRKQGISWGWIAIRLNSPEASVRRWYKEIGLRSEGQRIGKGGKFVAGRGDLYVGNMKAEGAVIPNTELASVIPVEKCLNYKAPAGEKKVVRSSRKPSTKKVTELADA